VCYKDDSIEESINTKFLGLQDDNHLNWKNDISLFPSSVEHVILLHRLHIDNIDTLKSVYFAYFHSIMKYIIVFWCNSSNK